MPSLCCRATVMESKMQLTRASARVFVSSPRAAIASISSLFVMARLLQPLDFIALYTQIQLEAKHGIILIGLRGRYQLYPVNTKGAESVSYTHLRAHETV